MGVIKVCRWLREKYRDRFYKKRWPQSKVSVDAIIEGDISEISIGRGTVVEPGVVLSTLYGGTISIGENCQILRGAMLLSYGGSIILGAECSVNPYSILYGHGGLTIGDYVRIAAHSVLIPANHSFDRIDVPIHYQPLQKKGISVGSDVWIGAGVRVLDGVAIGNGSVIAAGAIVTQSVEPYTVNGGVPSRTLKYRR